MCCAWAIKKIVSTCPPFEDVRLEYLIHGQEGGSWSAAPAMAAKEVLAARLRLEQGARVWRPLIWSASEWPTVVP